MKNALRLSFVLSIVAIALACTAPRPGSGRTSGPVAGKTNTPGKSEPIDTIRWTQPSNPKPPIKDSKNNQGNTTTPGKPGETYRVTLLLPFLTNQFDQTTVPEKSKLGLQFYAGARIALDQISKNNQINIIADVLDTQTSDAEFQTVLSDRLLAKTDVIIGPVRNSHVQTAAEWAKKQRKILISPESPNSELTQNNPDFIQINPSLRAHCEAITQYIQQKFATAQVTLLCKQKEADRLPYFQEYLANGQKPAFKELILPDETLNFDKIDLKQYFKPGKTAVFILPTWSSQDFVMSFLRKLKAVKGNQSVAVFGMPQWQHFESIEPEYLSELNTYISSATYINYDSQEVKDFMQLFYENTGTIPDEDAFNGYHVMRWTADMLEQYGLSFPTRLTNKTSIGLSNQFNFAKVAGQSAADGGDSNYDYLENKFLFILKFNKYGFAPVEN
jgi:ABC-type branched-subunit amino acid transport system substrate-binding protein